ncbi:histidine phosphatase superfamily [Kalaharituber pfeilii]|nr:histidine phosphatase superfamily [Kalaharituber pfeilii]
MSTLEPRPPYTEEELKTLYPSNLQLKLVQVLFRHGERTAVSARFQEEGVPPFWPYCKSAALFKSAVLNAPGNTDWSQLSYRRLIETHGSKGEPLLASGPGGSTEDLCQLGELTDKGRETTLALGARLKHLYMDQLNFLPKDLSNPAQFYFRASPIVRCLTSLQQVVTGIYPSHITANPPPDITILSRPPSEENLFPNEANCRRFRIISRAFAALAISTWNNHPDMQYLQSRIGKYVDGPVAVDGNPRLSGIIDSVNATLAHGKEVRLPPEFYEPRVREILNRINVDEWFRGYMQSSEVRRLGSGSLLGNFKDRMMDVVTGGSELKLALYGGHDTTVAAMLVSLGIFDGQWPPFSSNIAFELFKGHGMPKPILQDLPKTKEDEEGWGWWRWFGGREKDVDKRLDGYYVRLKYNDNPVVLKGCRPKGRHLDGDESFCTLAAFKSIVDKMAPQDWRHECNSNLDKEGIPPVELLEDEVDD